MSRREAILWGCAGAAGWVLAGYPAVLAALPRRPWRRDAAAIPRLSLVVPAYREREALARKLAALEAVDYPRERLEVLVAVDADPALVAVASDAWPDARVLFAAQRKGKAAALNRAVAAATGDVVVLTDANNVLDAASLRAAAQHFADPGVWGVAGRRGERGSAYDAYEELLRRLETRSGSVAAASGELFAVRRERIPAFPEEVVNDDLWLLCRLVQGGGRVIFEPAASSVEPPLPAAAEVARRSRIGAGRLMLLRELRCLPVGFGWRLLSHKHGRLALPFLLVLILTLSLSLAGRPGYRALAGVQVAGYALGLPALAGRTPAGPLGRACRASGQFLLGNYAVAIGVVRALRGRQSARWEPVR
jgi:cellulose synthase/poly-beta-1,6-N-acetylglucosamine synthase-like glycosyltransferase